MFTYLLTSSPTPIRPSLISHTVFVDVKHLERRKMWTTERRSCVNKEVGLGSQAFFPYPILPSSLISHTVSVDVKHHERKEKRKKEEEEKNVDVARS